MIAISIQRYDLFILASRLLQRYRQLTPDLRPLGLELALAIQYHRTQSHLDHPHQLPWIGAATGMSTQQLAQTICDPFYLKSHPYLPTLRSGSTPQDLIWPLFNQGNNGLVQPLAPSHLGGKFTERRWLKACNSQEGIGCHALAAHLWRDPSFLAEDRDLCPFRLYGGHYPLSIDQGRQTCGFDDHPCGWKPGLPKMLQVVGKGHQAEVLQAHWTEDMWAMLVPEHRPMPVYPVMVMLYFGHQGLQQGRTILTPEQFRLDFNFSMVQFRQLFLLDPDQSLNQQLVLEAEKPQPDWGSTPPTDWQLPTLHQPLGGRVLLDPDDPPTFRASGLPAGGDPLMSERRRRRQLERSPKHNEILHSFRRWFRLAGLEVREDQHYFDFLAVTDTCIVLAEIKLLYYQDMAEIIQEVIGQLFYYERFALVPWIEQGYPVHKAAVFDYPPLGDYVDFLMDLGISTYWITEDQYIDGPEISLRLLRQLEVQVRPDPEYSDN